MKTQAEIDEYVKVVKEANDLLKSQAKQIDEATTVLAEAMVLLVELKTTYEREMDKPLHEDHHKLNERINNIFSVVNR